MASSELPRGTEMISSGDSHSKRIKSLVIASPKPCPVPRFAGFMPKGVPARRSACLRRNASCMKAFRLPPALRGEGRARRRGNLTFS
jgi:hypothetical protein